MALMLSRWWIRLIASAKSGATEAASILSGSATGWFSTAVGRRHVALISRVRCSDAGPCPCVAIGADALTPAP